MPDLNANFQGQTLIIPGAYYDDNVSAALPVAQPPTPPLIVLGYGYGQKPFVPQTYTTPALLLAAMRGGPVADYVPFMTSPSGQLAGAGVITFINVAPNTQSAIALPASGGVSGVVLTSADYGLPSNLLQAQVATGSTAGRRLTIYDGYSGLSVAGDNLGIPFTMSYLGAASGVTFTVATSGGAAIRLTTTSPTSGESLAIPLGAGNFSTVSQVVQYINGTGFYSASLLSATNGQLPSASLDGASGTVLTSGGAVVSVTAQLSDVVYWVNQFGQGLASAALASGAVSVSGTPLSVLTLTPFSGATSVPPIQSNYASGFNVALTIPGWAVFADSATSGVIALGTQHANTASSPQNGKWRRYFTGSALGDSTAQALTKAASCNSINSTFVYPGIYRSSQFTGVNTLYDGLHAAAAIAGMATGNPPATPLTNKALTANGVEVGLTVPQIDQLQKGGIMPIWVSPTNGLTTIVSDFTTWLVDANPENVFNQQVACRDYLAYGVVGVLQPYVGTIAAPITETIILNAVKKYLNAAIYTQNNALGVIATWDASSLQLIYTGTQQLAAVSVSVALVGQNRFITALVNVQPLNIFVSGATAAATVL